MEEEPLCQKLPKKNYKKCDIDKIKGRTAAAKVSSQPSAANSAQSARNFSSPTGSAASTRVSRFKTTLKAISIVMPAQLLQVGLVRTISGNI